MTNRPTAEEFAQAPLFCPYIETQVAYTDYSAESLILDGYHLTREELEDGTMQFRLEGVDVIDFRLKEENGAPVWLGKFFDGREHRVHNTGLPEAAAEFAGEIHSLLKSRPDGFVFHMETNGVEFGPDVDLQGEGYDYDPDEDDDFLPVEYETEKRFGDPVRIVRDGFQAWIEGEDAPRLWGEVREEFARTGEDGTPLCPASHPILQQLMYMERMGENVARHREDLKSLRQLVGNPANIADQSLRAGVHMFDMVDSDLKDDVVPQAAIEEYRNAKLENWENGLLAGDAGRAVVPVDPTAAPAPRQAERRLEDLMQEATGFRVGSFSEIRNMPTYQQEQIRATTRPLFRGLFGEDFPMERVVVGRYTGTDPEAYAAFMSYFDGGELIKDVGPIRFDNMPGYETSHAVVRRRDGWDTLVFSDFHGTYAYAVPSPSLDNDLTQDGPEEEPENSFRM